MPTGHATSTGPAVEHHDVALVILDDFRRPIACTDEAFRVLSYPNDPSQLENQYAFLERKIGAELLVGGGNTEQRFVPDLRSGRRSYVCTVFYLQAPKSSPDRISMALLFERSMRTTVDLSRVTEQYGLTPRERELVQNLLLGLTTKEIANRMQVSASTVNAFLHLVMVKMGARTRSGVVRRIVCPQ